MIKKIIRKKFPKFYLELGRINHEFLEQYNYLNINNKISASKFTYLYNYITNGATPIEYNLLDFKGLKHKDKSKFITMRRNRVLNKKYNDSSSVAILDNKEKFNIHFSEFIKRKWIYVSDEFSEIKLKQFFDSIPNNSIIIKPNNLYYGLGISVSTTFEDLKKLIHRKSGG